MGERHRVRLTGKAGELELRHRTDVKPGMKQVKVERSDVRAWMGSGAERRAVADALEDIGVHADPRSQHDVEERLLAALERGHLVAVQPQARGASVPKPKPAAPASAAPVQKKAPTKISWISLQVVDEDKAPVPGLKYELTLPDKSTKSGVLDQQGHAYVEGIPDGNCEIRFPDLDTLEWNVG